MTDPSEQLRRDLRKRMRERLIQHMKDSLTLYEMTDVPRIDALEDITFVLFDFTISVAAAIEIEPKKFGELVEQSLREAKTGA
jgi:hypothetical protein